MGAVNLIQAPLSQTRLRYAVVYRPKVAHEVSGDAYLIHETRRTALLAVIDGLGSGQEAARASNLAREQILALAGEPLADIFQVCHRALHETRGAVMAILRIDFEAETAAFAGVGNIGIHVQSSAHDVKPISRNGIVGHRLPTIQESRYPYAPGDLFVMHSDGISSRFGLSPYHPIYLAEGLQAAAERIAATFGKDDDDVTLILACESPS